MTDFGCSGTRLDCQDGMEREFPVLETRKIGVVSTGGSALNESQFFGECDPRRPTD
jgi:hypothetical protein